VVCHVGSVTLTAQVKGEEVVKKVRKGSDRDNISRGVLKRNILCQPDVQIEPRSSSEGKE